jgi:hypothetical protein
MQQPVLMNRVLKLDLHRSKYIPNTIDSSELEFTGIERP